MQAEYINFIVVGIVLLLIGFLATRKTSKIDAPSVVGESPERLFNLPDLLFKDKIPSSLPGIEVVNNCLIFKETGRKPGYDVHRLECDLKMTSFLEKNTGEGKEGHFVVMTRASEPGFHSGNFRGNGWIIGSLWQGEAPPFGLPDFTKRACIEDWQNGINPEGWEFLKPKSLSHQLEDGKTYRVVYTSEKVEGGWNLSFSIDGFQSGPIFSDNQNVPVDSEVIIFASLGDGEISLTNISSTWCKR